MKGLMSYYAIHLFDIVAKWLVQSPHSMNVMGSNAGQGRAFQRGFPPGLLVFPFIKKISKGFIRHSFFYLTFPKLQW